MTNKKSNYNSVLNNVLKKIYEIIKKNIIFIALVLLIVLFGLTSPVFFTLSNSINLIIQTAVVSITACGMTISIIGGSIDLSIGSIYALAGMITALTIRATGNWVVGVIAGLCFGIFAGAINAFLSTKAKMPSFLATLATMWIFRGIAMTITETRDVLIPYKMYWHAFGDGYLFGKIPSQLIWVIVIALISSFLLKSTVLGKSIFAVGENIRAARFCGISTVKVKFYVLMICGFCAALSGIIISSQMHAARPLSGSGMELYAIAASILGGTSLHGGRGTISGAIWGSFIIAVLNNGLLLLGFNVYVQMIITGLIVIVAVVLNFWRKGMVEA